MSAPRPLRRWLLALLLGMAVPASVAANDCAAPSPPGIDESLYRTLERASEAINTGNAAQAVTQLDGVLQRLRGYERALVLQTRGYAHITAGNEAAALVDFKAALALDALPPEPQQQLLFNTAQLQITGGDANAGIALLERYLESACSPPPARAYLLLASALAERNRYAEALARVREAFERHDGPPPEDWLRFALGLHFALSDYAAAADVLVQLIARSPRNATYWQQLVGSHFEAGDRRRALAANALADRLGLLDDAEALRNLANLYMALDIPYKAGRVLADGIERGVLARNAAQLERTANAWIAAREWARADTALAAAAEASGDGALYRRLGQVRVARSAWAPAVTAFEQAIVRGVEDTADVEYQLGIAAWRAGDADTARRALERARRHGDRRAAAQQWLDYIENVERQ